ncbi:MAG: hypothetical protein COA99_11560 [Moraxellaceae bacterium]|nr:MAG: hypothetical protein COA99_11560 [Moraxellaceae bacterium]
MQVARSLSFKDAADQLFLSPSAVSRQIQGLEEALGKHLFKRGNRSITLTQDGEILLQGVEQAFSILESSLKALEPSRKTMTLRVGAQQYFSNNWLFPRISDFLADNPEIEIQFESSQTYQSFDETLMDICIRFAPAQEDSFVCESFFPQQAVLLAAPSLVEKFDLQDNAQRASECEWLTLRSQPGLMQRWFEENGDFSDHSCIQFDDAQAALMAAKEGVGVVLAAWPLVNELITSKQLVQLGPANSSISSDYYLVYPKSLADYLPLVLFKEWLKEQALLCATNQ